MSARVTHNCWSARLLLQGANWFLSHLPDLSVFCPCFRSLPGVHSTGGSSYQHLCQRRSNARSAIESRSSSMSNNSAKAAPSTASAGSHVRSCSWQITELIRRDMGTLLIQLQLQVIIKETPGDFRLQMIVLKRRWN